MFPLEPVAQGGCRCCLHKHIQSMLGTLAALPIQRLYFRLSAAPTTTQCWVRGLPTCVVARHLGALRLPLGWRKCRDKHVSCGWLTECIHSSPFGSHRSPDPWLRLERPVQGHSTMCVRNGCRWRFRTWWSSRRHGRQDERHTKVVSHGPPLWQGGDATHVASIPTRQIPCW